MIKQFKILEKRQYCVYVQLDDDNFDYYSDAIITIRGNGVDFIIYKDNLLYLKNVINNIKEIIEDIDLDKIDEMNIGILLNIYYKSIFDELADDRIIFNEFDEWIGEKYMLFSSNEYATWLYRNKCKYTIKITPIYNAEYKYEDEFEKFLANYRDILCEDFFIDDLTRISQGLLDIIERYL